MVSVDHVKNTLAQHCRTHLNEFKVNVVLLVIPLALFYFCPIGVTWIYLCSGSVFCRVLKQHHVEMPCQCNQLVSVLLFCTTTLLCCETKFTTRCMKMVKKVKKNHELINSLTWMKWILSDMYYFKRQTIIFWILWTC